MLMKTTLISDIQIYLVQKYFTAPYLICLWCYRIKQFLGLTKTFAGRSKHFLCCWQGIITANIWHFLHEVRKKNFCIMLPEKTVTSATLSNPIKWKFPVQKISKKSILYSKIFNKKNKTYIQYWLTAEITLVTLM